MKENPFTNHYLITWLYLCFIRTLIPISLYSPEFSSMNQRIFSPSNTGCRTESQNTFGGRRCQNIMSNKKTGKCGSEEQKKGGEFTKKVFLEFILGFWDVHANIFRESVRYQIGETDKNNQKTVNINILV